MIEWWWLLVEGGVVLVLAAMNRGIARKAALWDAISDPIAARREVERRSRMKPGALDPPFDLAALAELRKSGEGGY